MAALEDSLALTSDQNLLHRRPVSIVENSKQTQCLSHQRMKRILVSVISQRDVHPKRSDRFPSRPMGSIDFAHHQIHFIPESIQSTPRLGFQVVDPRTHVLCFFGSFHPDIGGYLFFSFGLGQCFFSFGDCLLPFRLRPFQVGNQILMLLDDVPKTGNFWILALTGILFFLDSSFIVFDLGST